MTIDIREAIIEAEKRVEANRRAIREALDNNPPPPGLKPVDDATFMAFIEGIVQQYPPEPMVTPDGQVIVESPWIVMCSLGNVDGGKQIIDRILRVRKKAEADNAVL